MTQIEQIKAEMSENIGQLEFLRNEAIEMIAALEHDISISIYDGKKGHDPEAEAELEQWRLALEWLEHFREATKKMQPSEDLEKELVNYFGAMPEDKDKIAVARHFAEWQKKQDDELLAIAHFDGVQSGKETERKEMMKEAVEGYIEGDWRKQEDAPYELYATSDELDSTKYKMGDRVKLIILKEDE